VPRASIVTITNGVDTDEFCPGSGDRTRFGLPEGKVIGLFAGDLTDPRKNLDTVLKALVAVPELHLAIAGEYKRTKWAGLVERLGLSSRVHFLGFQKDMPQLMRAVDLVLLPSRYEPFGLVILEALATGLPVVTTRSAGASALMTEQVGIVLEDGDDDRAMAQALRTLVSSDDRRQALGRAARKLALQHSWRTMAGQYIALLEAAAQSRRAA
jgi:glycosyltransferase involved in cell wall biosynthesis